MGSPSIFSFELGNLCFRLASTQNVRFGRCLRLFTWPRARVSHLRWPEGKMQSRRSQLLSDPSPLSGQFVFALGKCVIEYVYCTHSPGNICWRPRC